MTILGRTWHINCSSYEVDKMSLAGTCSPAEDIVAQKYLISRRVIMAVEQRQARSLLLHGVIGGIIAGIVFAMFEMVVAMMMGDSFFAPLRMIGSMVLGTEALMPTYPLLTAAMVGLIVHMILSAIYGAIFVYLLAYTDQLVGSTGLLLLYGSLFGLALWIVNFLIIAPFVWPQFTMVDQFWMGFVAHTFFFGTVLGGYVAAARPGGVTTAAR